MKTQDIFDLAIKEGLRADFRDKQDVKEKLDSEKKNYERLSKKEKSYYDVERFKHPYNDSRVHFVTKKNPDIKRILVGIDMEIGEVMLADRLGEKSKPIDLIFAHHPEGKAFADLAGVMDMLEDLYHRLGVPIHVAENLMKQRISEVHRGVHPANHMEAISAAKLLNLSFLNVHTPTDNLVWRYLQELYDKEKPRSVKNVMDILMDIPEYQEATRMNAGPQLVSGAKENRAGKVMVDMTGGTSPHDSIYEELSRAGVSTIVGMHFKEPTIKKIKKHHLNVIVAGHHSSDSMGLNLFLDKLENKGIEIVPCSGLIRVKR
ncbi:NGG1p interacting factor NIF3 [Patescibacteria group bacterium]|nr:NGG1p interacting factor NIF3 [Patescibacteria group bacterium]